MFRRKKKKLFFKDIEDFSKYKGYYCLIRLEGVKLGIFSYFLVLASAVAECMEKGLIPIIDLKNVKNEWNKGKGIEYNPWNLYYKQPAGFDLEDVDLDSTRIIIRDDYPAENIRPCDSMEFLTNDIAVAYWRSFLKKYFVCTDEMQKFLDARYQGTIAGKKTLGVLCRGTDYKILQPKEHPVQPEVADIINKVKEVLEEKGYTHVYLATEDIEVAEKFQEAFGEKLIVSKDMKVGYEVQEYLSTYMEHEKIDFDSNTKEYLASMYILSKCNALVAGRTSGSVAAFLMSDGYEYHYFYNLGRYKLNNYYL